MSAAGEHISITDLLIGIALIWAASKLLNYFLNKLKLPAVLGELCTGFVFSCILFLLVSFTFQADILFYNSLDSIRSFFLHQFQFIKNSHVLLILGELGIILLLFEVGLETELKQITSVGKEALLVALGGVVAPFGMAWALEAIFNFGWSTELVLFVGLVLAATSIGVTARVFQDLKVLHTLNAQIVLGAAVIDDVMGLILLSVISAVVRDGGISVPAVLLITFKSVLFLGVSVWLAPRVNDHLVPKLNRLSQQDPLSLLIWVLVFCFSLSAIAKFAGLEPIVGAFAAGVVLDHVKLKGLFGETKTIEDFIAPIRSFLAPIFFVNVGFAIDPSSIFAVLPLLLTFVACISKLVSGWLFLPFKTSMNRLVVGVGMMPRGEVGLVVASIGSQIGLLQGELYSGILVAVILTTLIGPLWLQIILKNQKKKQVVS
ncbi:MAG TPA: cation:proton antiporter [Vampirovibrionales bacterium]